MLPYTRRVYGLAVPEGARVNIIPGTASIARPGGAPVRLEPSSMPPPTSLPPWGRRLSDLRSQVRPSVQDYMFGRRLRPLVKGGLDYLEARRVAGKTYGGPSPRPRTFERVTGIAPRNGRLWDRILTRARTQAPIPRPMTNTEAAEVQKAAGGGPVRSSGILDLNAARGQAMKRAAAGVGMALSPAPIGATAAFAEGAGAASQTPGGGTSLLLLVLVAVFGWQFLKS